MPLSKEERITRINDFSKIIAEKGLDHFIDNHANDILEVALTEAEWFKLAKADAKILETINNMPSEKKASLLENIFHANQKQTQLTEHSEQFSAYKPKLRHHPEILEKDGSGVLYLEDAVFQSWERSISSLPQYTFFPKSKQAIQNIIKWAKVNAPDLTIRAAGYRHTCSDLYVENDQILISMLDYETALRLPAKHPHMDPYNDLQGIQLLGEIEEDGQTKMLCKLGASTCNFHFQDWVHDPFGGNLNWALPLNVIMTEITFGGSNAPICHGAGINNKTLSDLVAEIEFVDVNGNIQKISDPEQLKAAAGAFGMLGIVTSLTLKLDKLTYANMCTTQKKPLYLTIPPPSYQDVPNELKPWITPDMLKNAKEEFIDRCENHYYSEWFWFPTQNECYINTWNNDGNPEDAVRYPDKLDVKWQETSSYMAELANMSIFKCGLFTAKQHAKILSKLCMQAMPDLGQTVCTVEDAEHFRHGIQNIRQRMVEFEIEIPSTKDNPNKPDWSIVQKLWWDVINCANDPKNQEDYPLRTTLEMRIMGGSDVIMAPQHGNKWTCAIEILTVPTVDQKIWIDFSQQILDAWCKYKKPDGTPLQIRPHWAKGFDDLKMHGMPIYEYLKKVSYKKEIPEFKKQLANIAKQHGFSLKTMIKRFSNRTLKSFYWDYPKHVLNHHMLYATKKEHLDKETTKASEQEASARVAIKP